ncbi:MAG: hypothetical protein LBS33_06555 [Streptococcaceae bacterium]|jgi:hypothetical protein|nr:hypothetical protein [Streptococcaceae bacterium]
MEQMKHGTKNRRFFKAILVALVTCLFTNILLPTVNTFASEKDDVYQKLAQIDQKEFERILEQITEYSEYDYANKKWILNHDIVTDGIFTEQQYQNAEKAGQEWEKVETLANKSKKGSIAPRVLPALLILAIKAVGVIAGGAVVNEITTAFTRWGLSAGCKKFKKFGPVKSFCQANGYL